MPNNLVIREFKQEDLSILPKLVLDAENFGEPFLESEMLLLRRDSMPDFGSVYVALIKARARAQWFNITKYED